MPHYHRTASTALLVVALLLRAIAATARQDSPDPAIAALLAWVAERGGQAHVRVGRNAHGIRGLLTQAPVAAGDLLVSIPASLAIKLGSPDESAPELGIALLREVHRTKSRFQMYLATLPGLEEQLCADNLPSALLPLLPRDELVELVEGRQAWGHRVFEGSAQTRIPLVRALPPGQTVGALEFAWASCMTSSRAIAMHTVDQEGTMFLIPVLDLANHRHGSPNLVRYTHGAGKDGTSELHLQLIAGEDMAEGEEVTISYGSLRADEAAMFYGFPLDVSAEVQGDQEGRAGQLCAVDQLDFDVGARPGKVPWPAPFSGSREETLAEVARLKERLAQSEAREHTARQFFPDDASAVEACVRSLEGNHHGLCEAMVVMLRQLKKLCDQGLQAQVQQLASRWAAPPDEL